MHGLFIVVAIKFAREAGKSTSLAGKCVAIFASVSQCVDVTRSSPQLSAEPMMPGREE